MFSPWTFPSDEDEPHRRVNEPEKKVKKRKWWQRRQKVEMQDVEGEKGNEVKGEEMGQGVEQKVLEDQADQTPKMEKQVVLGKNKPEKKVKKRKWWQRRQKVEMPDGEDEKGNGVMVERESEGLENQVTHVEEQMVLENQTKKLDEPVVLMNQIQNLEKQVAQESQMDKLDKQAVLEDQRQKLVKKMILVIEIEMKEVEVQVVLMDPMPNLEERIVLKNEAQRLEKQVVLMDPMPNLEQKMVLKNQAQRLEKQVLPMDHMKHVEERVVLQNHMQNLKVQAVQTNPMEKHKKQVVCRNQMQNQVVLMVERDRLVGIGDWINKMVKQVSNHMVLMDGTDKPKVDLMDQTGNLEQVGLQDQMKNLEAQVVLRNQKNESNKRVVLVVDRKKLEKWLVLIDQVYKLKQGGLEGRRKENNNQVVLRYSKNNMNKLLVQMFQMEKLDSALQDMDEAPEHQWTELQDPAALELIEEQNLDRGWTGDPLKNISEVSSNKADHQQLQDDVLVPSIVEAQPEESGALMETSCEDEGVSVPADVEVEENQTENQTPSTGYKILKGFIIGAAAVLTVIIASRRLPSIFNV
ncbi:calponin homology domain-containing protein DDB_G0272472-like [Trichomycterus rosablanca]|uniref:calponin homology domain-containing protein DDB_G0272472-like n=1 Tax=Trichomycterus rosablanca TaxID=2290929 RepID=UPI002F360A37